MDNFIVYKEAYYETSSYIVMLFINCYLTGSLMRIHRGPMVQTRRASCFFQAFDHYKAVYYIVVAYKLKLCIRLHRSSNKDNI